MYFLIVFGYAIFFYGQFGIKKTNIIRCERTSIYFQQKTDKIKIKVEPHKKKRGCRVDGDLLMKIKKR